MALTSSSGVVVSNEITYVIKKSGTAGGKQLSLYIDYTLGVSDTGVSIQPAYNDAGVDAEFYDETVLVTGDITLNPVGIAATGKYRHKLDTMYNEDTVKLTVSGLVDGNLNIEFKEDNPFV